MFLTCCGTYVNIWLTLMEVLMHNDKLIFWKDLAGAAALAVVIIATLHLPLFA